jgi:hypothetical protein
MIIEGSSQDMNTPKHKTKIIETQLQAIFKTNRTQKYEKLIRGFLINPISLYSK